MYKQPVNATRINSIIVYIKGRFALANRTGHWNVVAVVVTY